MKYLKVIVISVACFFSANSLFGWGNGHDYVNSGALTIMPDEIKSFLGEKYQKKFIRWSHIPDNGTPFDEIDRSYAPITDKEIEYLKSFKEKSFYCLHSHRKPGEGGNFILLIRAFMDKDPGRSALWMAALMHTIADDVACNHTSQIHYLTYAFRGSNVKMGNGIGFDFADIAKTDEGQKAINSLLEKYNPQIIPGTPEEVLTKIISQNIDASTYGTLREFKIVTTYAPDVTPEQREDGVKAMAELGVYGMTKGMDIIATAWKFAQEGKVPVLTDEVLQNAKKNRNEYLETKPLADDSIYTGLLTEGSDESPSIGILLERSKLMMKSHLSFGGRLIMAASMRTLKSNEIPYHTIDLRELNVPNSNALDIKKTPVLMLCSGSFHVSNNVKNNLKRYFSEGGRILWIGGRDKGLLGDLSKSLKKTDPVMLPVSDKYGRNNTEIIDKIRIKFLPPLNEKLGDKQYRFCNNPDTTAGSQKPKCLLKLEPINNKIIPLVELSVEKKTICVAAELTDDKGNARAIFLPEYLLAPFLLDDTGTNIVNVADITLDRVAAPVLLEAIKLLNQFKSND